MLMPNSSPSSRTIIRRFPRITPRNISTWSSFVVVEFLSRPGIFADRISALFKTLKPLKALHSAHTVLPVCLVKELKYLCKIFTNLAAKCHARTHTHTHTRCTWSSFIVTCHYSDEQLVHVLSSAVVAQRPMFIVKREKWQFFCQNLTLGALSSRGALYVLVGALFKKFRLYLNTPRITMSDTPETSVIETYPRNPFVKSHTFHLRHSGARCWMPTVLLISYSSHSCTATPTSVSSHCPKQVSSVTLHT